jgi:PAS domain S-box-containing protein
MKKKDIPEKSEFKGVLTGRRKSSGEAALLYYAIFEQSPHGILLIDTDGTIIEFNEAAHRDLGYSKEEFAGLRLADIDPFQSPRQIKASIGEVLKKGKAEFEVRHRTRAGDVRNVHVITKVTELSGRKVFQTIWQDITERKRAEEELKKYREHLEELIDDRTAALKEMNAQLKRDIAERKNAERAVKESEKRYRMLFESAGEAIFILEGEGKKAGRIVAANRSAAEMHGYSVEQLLSLSISDLDAPEAAQKVPSRMRRILKGEWIKAEINHRKKDGTMFPVEINAGLLELGNHKYVLAFDRDITKRKLAEQEREKLIVKLQDALEKIKTLRGLLPMCAWCKKIRDDKGYWKKVEDYLREHSDATFTHGICPECLKKVSPETYDEKFRRRRKKKGQPAP